VGAFLLFASIDVVILVYLVKMLHWFESYLLRSLIQDAIAL